MNPSPAAISVTKLIGTDIISTQRNTIGRVEDLMLDLVDGCVSYAIVSFDRFLGAGYQRFALPLSALDFDVNEQKLVLNITVKKLRGAPSVADHLKTKSDTQSDSWLMGLYDYYEDEHAEEGSYSA